MNQLYAQYWEDYLRENPIAATYNGDQRYNHLFGLADCGRSACPEPRAGREISGPDGYLRSSHATGRRPHQLRSAALPPAASTDGLRFPTDLMPVDQFAGLHLSIAQLGSGSSAQPFQTVQDYDNWSCSAQPATRPPSIT
jgi:hypothetical protein